MLRRNIMVAKSEAFVKAETSLKAALAQTIPDAEVQIGVGLPNVGVGLITQGDEDEAKRLETLRITVQSTEADTNPAGLRDKLMAALKQIQILEQNVQFESDEQHALAMRAELEKFIAKGADIPANFLEWIGFSDKQQRPSDYAFNIEKADGIITLGARVIGDNVNAEEMKKSLEADLSEIKEMLAQRIAKYKGVDRKDEKAMQAIRDKINPLHYEVFTDQFNINPGQTPRTAIIVKIMTDDQKKTLADPAQANDHAKLETQGKDNILNELTTEQLGKAIGRSFLFAGKNAVDRFPKLSGRKDMERAVVTSLLRLEASHPELAAEINEFRTSDTFKAHHNYDKKPDEKPVLKSKPFVNKDPNKPGEMTIDLSLQSGKAAEIIAALGDVQQTATPEMPASVTPEAPAVDDKDKEWAAKFDKKAEEQLGKNDAPPASAVERLTKEESAAAVGATR
jgi:hypothetical protein